MANFSNGVAIPGSNLSDEIKSTTHGINVLVSGLTGGSIWVEVWLVDAWVRIPNMEITADGYNYYKLDNGRRARLAFVGATGTVKWEIKGNYRSWLL